MKSSLAHRIPLVHVWEGGNGGGTHDPSRGIAGNSREPKRIVSPGSRRGGEWTDQNHLITEAVNAQSAPHGRRQTVAAGNGRLLNYSIARLLRA